MMQQLVRGDSSMEDDVVDVNDRYQCLREVGKGSYGEVWLVTPLRQRSGSSSKNTNKQYVLKRLNLGGKSQDTKQNDIESAEREAQLLSTLKHPNIVSYIESFRSSDGFLNIVMAYCEGGDLYTKLKEQKDKKQPLTENQIAEWFLQICMALQYMHDKSILHRDLKTQNIFLTKNDIVKVGDLGIARVLESGNDLATTIIGTPYYMSPEIFSNQPYGQKSDIWALGCCVFEMTTLEHAFNAKDMNSLVLKIIRGQIPQTSKRYSDQLTDLIKSMLNRDPEARPTARKILQNSYMKKHIVQLLDKTKMKCQTNGDDNSSMDLNVSNDSQIPSSPTARRRSIEEPKVSNRPLPVPVLPSHSHPPLPPSDNRPPINNKVLPPSKDSSRSELSVKPVAPSDARARRRNRARQMNSIPVLSDDPDIDFDFVMRIHERDTLHRFKREQKLNNHLKQHLAASYEEEQESARVRKPSNNVNSLSPARLVKSPKRLTRPNSATSSVESDQSKVSNEDELNPVFERETNQNSVQSHSQPKTHQSLDSNSNARKRRRQNRIQSSSSSGPVDIQNGPSHSTSQESINGEIDKKKEGEKDMDELVFALKSTLKLAPVGILLSDLSDIDQKSSTTTSVESDRTLVDQDSITNTDPEPNCWPSSLPFNRINSRPFDVSNRYFQRFQRLREECLRDISPEKLDRILSMSEDLNEDEIRRTMINELGFHLYEKYWTQIFILQCHVRSLNRR